MNGYDLNRNWDVTDPSKMPEIAAQRNAVNAWIRGGHTIDLFFSLHNTETGEYLEGPPDGGRQIQPLAERFFQIPLHRDDLRSHHAAALRRHHHHRGDDRAA